MICTECKERAPGSERPRRGRMSAADRKSYGDVVRNHLVKLGWFVYGRGAPVRFAGVVLCPDCRQKSTAKDGYGNVYPTAELEELASGGKARAS